jgi:hypothetical protein
MGFSRFNALDQALDIAGSLVQSQTMTLSEEPLGYGAPISGQTGAAATISAFATPIATITGLTGMTAQSVGRMLTLGGAASGGNNGTFLITAFNSSTSVDIRNAAAVTPDANDGAITWTERQPYSLEDDINYIRSDRQAIKGTTNWYDAVPVYQRPTAIGTNVPANLTNIAGKTTDARGFITRRAFYEVPVAATNTFITLSSPGNLKHSDAVDKTGVPVFDAAPYTGLFKSCYVEITDGYVNSPLIGGDNEIVVQAGPHAGEKIFGVTNAGASTSPNSVEVVFYSVPYGKDILTNSTLYTWEASQPTVLSLAYGYFQRLDLMPDDEFLTIHSLGISSDGDLRADINNLQQTMGSGDGYTSLNGFLTNTSANYVFFNLPDATPSVVEALNTLNAQIGDRTYTGGILTSGQTIAASLQALSSSIGNTTITRTIERLAATLNANTAHTLPGGLTYTLDGTNNGQYLWVYTRGLLRDPGPVSGDNDYSETSTTSVTFYSKLNAKDHINYFKKG